MFRLNYRDSRPIYEQVKDELRKLIVTGVISPGEKLPSVRSLSGSLAINPNTIQRAYEALEQEGYAHSVAGKGSFAALPQEVGSARRDMLLAKLDGIVLELKYLGVSADELSARVSCSNDDSTEEGSK